MPTIATISNMTKHYHPGVLAYSSDTGEGFSANPNDYFWLDTDEPLNDSNGNPMHLVRRLTRLVDVADLI